ncbi:MAG: glycoside hydrolase family 140 protein [Sedimentisphaerales bacterium]|nr:glycoside hydrolase family 140 protein [Sedimentisphaerales bacterium]
MKTKLVLLLFVLELTAGCAVHQSRVIQKPWDNGRLVVSQNGRFIQHENGEPFFWLGDTGWLLFQKLNRDEVEIYLENRRQKGFNVIQAMALHSLPEVNYYGDLAVADSNPAQPVTTSGNNPENKSEYDYWDHVDFVVETAARKGIYIAIVPTWGSIVKGGRLTAESARTYGKWIAERYRDKPNIIWINGGDVRGDDHAEIWQILGNTIHQTDSNHLMTFHPFGRTQSSTWFHSESWLDFNMFQSGHRRYDQRRPTDDIETWKGEDNWKYVLEDYEKEPRKPTIDGEPSYENIPQGLHDPKEPYWHETDARRYAYWSVFAGSFGHTYGNNSVMQMHKPDSGTGSFGVLNYWNEAIDDPGAGQMQYLKSLMLSRPFFERIFDPSMIKNNGEKYDFVTVTRGKSYAFIYTYTGRSFDVTMGKISGGKVRALWYNPRNGKSELSGYFDNEGIKRFDPPGEKAEGSDWVLVLDDTENKFPVIDMR